MMARKKKQVAEIIEFPKERVIRVLDPKTLQPRVEPKVKKPKKQTVRAFLDEIYQLDCLTHRTKKEFTEGLFMAFDPEQDTFSIWSSDGIDTKHALWSLEQVRGLLIHGLVELPSQE